MQKKNETEPKLNIFSFILWCEAYTDDRPLTELLEQHGDEGGCKVAGVADWRSC